ncbi:hypothetical protein HYPSUDRAFT_201032 [Hypholoma sublateritium FD-334 SS-4]|uniref:Uncharacterized protein n=1 Tax=Hypholoma sublateritium (strain FD-334 SS-4) TaxID=945553 RepID=A0A0D2L9K0_HYPSF|nr:hypothetical protein HYPSUDRAFT_201032 [Hypholoma sublateritium FD-334 SS-4]
MAKPQLSLEARRIRLIIVSLPILVASSFVLYKRLYLGEEQRTLPKTLNRENSGTRLIDEEKPDAPTRVG